MGQNDSEAQSHTLTAFLQDLSSPVDNDDVSPALRTNNTQEGGTLFVLLVQSATDPLKHN